MDDELLARNDLIAAINELAEAQAVTDNPLTRKWARMFKSLGRWLGTLEPADAPQGFAVSLSDADVDRIAERVAARLVASVPVDGEHEPVQPPVVEPEPTVAADLTGSPHAEGTFVSPFQGGE